MRVIAIVDCQPRLNSFFELLGVGEVAALEEASAQHAEEQFHLVEPRTVDWGEVERVFVTGVAQKLPAFPASPQGVGDEAYPTALSDPLADL